MGKDNRKHQYPQGKNIIKESKVLIPEKKKSSALFIIIAFCLPVLIYLQTLNFGLSHLDDDNIITKKYTFLSDLGNARKAFLTDAFADKSSSFYRPLQTLSYMADIKLSGGNKNWMYHLSNVLLLGAISCLLFLLFRRLLIPPKLALLSTLVFCAHPLFVSSVAWIPARGDLLLLMFSLISFLFFIEFLQKKKIIYLLLNWAAFTIALFCKETAALLPLLFILYYYAFIPEKRFGKRYFFIIIIYAVSGIFWLWLRSIAIGGIVSNKNYSVDIIPLLANLRTIPESLAKFFLPFDFGTIPGFTIFYTLTGLLLMAAIIYLFFKNNERTKKEKVFCFAWFLLLMLPPMLYRHMLVDYLDHRFFLPLIGILLFVLFIIPKKWMAKGDIKRAWLLAAALVVLCSFTFIKSRSYTDPATYYNSAISHNPISALAYYGRGIIRANKGDNQGALPITTR